MSPFSTNTTQMSEGPSFEAGTRTFTNVVLVLLLVGVAVLGAARHLERERADALRAKRIAQLQTGLRELDQSHTALIRYLLGASTDALKAVPVHEHNALSEFQELASTAQSPEQRLALQTIITQQQKFEESFARQLIAERKNLDSGKSTLADLEITYLQLDPDQWFREFDNVSKSALREFEEPYTH